MYLWESFSRYDKPCKVTNKHDKQDSFRDDIYNYQPPNLPCQICKYQDSFFLCVYVIKDVSNV